MHPYTVGDEVHGILRATFDAQNVLAYKSREGLHVFIVDVRASHTHAREAVIQEPIVYSFGIIIQPMNYRGLLNACDMRAMFDQCLSDGVDDVILSDNDKYAHYNLVFVIRAYDDNGECEQCSDGIAHSVWSWIKCDDKMVPRALSRVISCSARTISNVLMREVRALNMVIGEIVDERHAIQVPSYIPRVRPFTFRAQRQESMSSRCTEPIDGITICIHPHPTHV